MSVGSVQSLDRLDHQGDTSHDSAKILFQSFVQEAIVSSSGMDRDVHSLMLSIQHFLRRPRRRAPCKVPFRMVLERLLWHVTYMLKPWKSLSLDSCQRGSCGPATEEVDFALHSVVALLLLVGDVENFSFPSIGSAADIRSHAGSATNIWSDITSAASISSDTGTGVVLPVLDLLYHVCEKDQSHLFTPTHAFTLFYK